LPLFEIFRLHWLIDWLGNIFFEEKRRAAPEKAHAGTRQEGQDDEDADQY
jgi:hypothetical protein